VTLWRTEVTFLGHVINEHGVSMEENKIAAVTHWPRPNDPHDIRSFLALLDFIDVLFAISPAFLHH
jgi:hypothetical protein